MIIFLAEGHLLLPPKVKIKFNQRFKEKTLTRLSDSHAAGFHTAESVQIATAVYGKLLFFQFHLLWAVLAYLVFNFQEG
jgi:hypothetical protein